MFFLLSEVSCDQYSITFYCWALRPSHIHKTRNLSAHDGFFFFSDLGLLHDLLLASITLMLELESITTASNSSSSLGLRKDVASAVEVIFLLWLLLVAPWSQILCETLQMIVGIFCAICLMMLLSFETDCSQIRFQKNCVDPLDLNQAIGVCWAISAHDKCVSVQSSCYFLG